MLAEPLESVSREATPAHSPTQQLAASSSLQTLRINDRSTIRKRAIFKSI